jgi:hypothetical protein
LKYVLLTLIRKVTEHADRRFEGSKIKIAMSPFGVELVETDPPVEVGRARSTSK